LRRFSGRYNQIALKSPRVLSVLIFLLFCGGISAAGGANRAAGGSLLVTPFENQSKAPGIEWIGESFPELFAERLNQPSLYLAPREDRVRVYDRIGIPADLHASRATLYRIAEQMDVDYVLFGRYGFDGRTFTASAQLLDMHRLRLLPEAHESGPLVDLIHIQTALAWDTLRSLGERLSSTEQAWVERAPPIRLDAFENYVRGIIASGAAEEIRYFREAVRLDPNYAEAWLHLGKLLYREGQYDGAMSSLAHVPEASNRFEEASFYLGLAAFFQQDFPRSEAEFMQVAARMPLSEVYNNLGVVAARQAKPIAIDYFRQAVNSDPDDAGYRFNLAIELCRSRDWGQAGRELREVVARQPNDSEAASLLNSLPPNERVKAQASPPALARDLPQQKIRTDYNEGPFRQLAIAVDAAAEQRLDGADPGKDAQFYLDRGRDFLARGFIGEAQMEFRESIALDPDLAEAHAGLACALEATDDAQGARLEAEAALRQRQFAEPFLVLARLDLRDNRVDSASQNVTRALRLEPSNDLAQALERTIAAKLAEKAQPLPNQ
jgi:tetratricopeptide (TPR) repeat protein